MHFTYSAGESESALDTVHKDLRAEAAKHGGMPSWVMSGGGPGDVWLVKGSPWREVSYCA